MQVQYQHLKTVIKSTFIHEIHIAKAKLSSHGIDSHIFDEHLTFTIGTAFIEEYKLMVSESDFDKALTIVSLYKT